MRQFNLCPYAALPYLGHMYLPRLVCLHALFALASLTQVVAQKTNPLHAEIDRRAAAVQQDLIAWRRYLHQNPELSNRETNTSAYIVAQLQKMGLEPQTGIAKNGVVAILKGGKPGKVVALRADMDGLPVTEQVDLPFRSKAIGEYEGKPVGVMHACGHDTHVAILLAVAQVLKGMQADLPGTVKFIFQPAEEGAPAGDPLPAGAEAMVAEGVMTNPTVDAVFGLHVSAPKESGVIFYRSGPYYAAADKFELIVHGRQTHGARPWGGVDPIVVGAQIVNAFQTIVSRTQNITHEPAIVTVGQFQAGVRNNIIPDSVRMTGTIRTFDDGMQADIHARLTKLATQIAEANGARATVRITKQYPVTINDPALTARMLPTLERVAPGRVRADEKITGAEDFTFFARKAPGLYINLGITPAANLATAASNHSPLFYVDEAALPTGVLALSYLTIDYLTGK